MDIIKFTLTGLLAHFKTGYTNSSKLIYEIPSFTVIEGMIGALLGFDKWDYHKKIDRDNMTIGIKIEKPIQRIMLTLNQIELVSPFTIGNDYGLIKERTQIPMEHLFQPEFTIYISHRNLKLFDCIKKNVLKKRAVYPIYFGSAYCLAEITEAKELRGEKRKFVNSTCIDTIIGITPDNPLHIDFSKTTKILKETLPYKRDDDFTIKEYIKVIYNPDASGIYSPGTFFHTEEGENIYLFEV